MTVDTATAEVAPAEPAVSHMDMANAIRFLSADAVQRANSGHPGMPMGMADVATVLFSKFLKFDAADPDWPDRDRFVLSAGHGSMLMYSLLYLTGVEPMTIEQIKNFRQMGSITAGHPEYGHAPGIETTTGPLGQGITNAVGMALAERMMNARHGDDAVDHYTYAIAGDGCLMEGISHEAISMAGALQLSKLIVLFDDNDICIDGPTDMAVRDDQPARFAASGWHVQSIDGHDPDAIAAAIEAAKASNQPSMIACKTVIGFGAPTKAGTASTHGSPLGDEEIAGAREKLGWPHAPFDVPADVLGAWNAVGARGSAANSAWRERVAGDDFTNFHSAIAGDLPDGWLDAVSAHKARCSEETPNWATRKASGEALSVLTEAIPALIGGSADLTGSVNTKTPSTGPVTPDDFSGRYIHYGVREHAMGAVMNGMALHGGLIPYGGTFLVFADYMKGAMRLSALMGQRVVYVLTHDSIGLGEDGPTHQAVETLATLRATPNFKTYRPCDPIEAVECWALALADTAGPAGMVLSRQGVPTVRTTHTDENLSARGAYVLADAEGGERQATILATGSEVSIALAARDALHAEGVATAVVSVPCWELFDEQDADYRSKVLGAGAIRVAVEAGVRMGWDKYIRSHGGFIGMTGFGASAPAGQLFEHFGITAEKVVEEVKVRL
ncbi:MAG: transketolase [Rhodospirillaceae bacterium]|nr:transketolase [Rhodospirillaceae bacterium]MBT6085962.1 transketolase [Rhodospirillaceae bacterium]MBT6610325.1 transketolase [Rhodospirillaceae bacterium]MBT6886304.1 transketolase [Rhodospirillaceae bacterium]